MDRFFRQISERNALSTAAAQQLDELGFVTISAFPPKRMADISAAYDEVMAAAWGEDYKWGSTTTRLFDLVNREATFDDIYVQPSLLEACAHVIGAPFKLSSLLARTVRPNVPAQGLHADLPRDSKDSPMVAFILMIDPFNSANGATRFIPKSHNWLGTPPDRLSESSQVEVLACGEAGSMIVFNGAIWHGHAANATSKPRRSIQGYFIRRSVRSGVTFTHRMVAATASRLTPFARYLLSYGDEPKHGEGYTRGR